LDTRCSKHSAKEDIDANEAKVALEEICAREEIDALQGGDGRVGRSPVGDLRHGSRDVDRCGPSLTAGGHRDGRPAPGKGGGGANGSPIEEGRGLKGARG